MTSTHSYLNYRKVLDHGHIRLVEALGNDLSIVRSARVSYDADWRGTEDESKDEKLLVYLLRNRHTSPFESVVFTFEIKCPIFVARQWHRHRTWSYNEVSARYTELPEECYIPEEKHITLQSTSNKQMRTAEPHPNAPYWRRRFKDEYEQDFALYKRALEDGVPRELARTVLPLATYTRFFATVDLHNLLHFIGLRIHSHAQYEIRVYAEQILSIISYVVPITVKHWRSLYLDNQITESTKEEDKKKDGNQTDSSSVQTSATGQLSPCAHKYSIFSDGSKKCIYCGDYIPAALA